MSVLEIKDLVKRYGDFSAVDHFNLTIQEGEILGLLGPNGSGKTTTINCLLSLLTYEFGSIHLFGKPMKPDAYDLKQHIGIVPQNVAVFEELNVNENIDYFCGLYVKDKATRKAYVQDAIAFVGLEEFTTFLPKQLSGGLLRRLNIACGIAHKPKFIVFDEPTVAVDPQSRNRILEGIKDLNRSGSTILYTSHYMEEVEQICSRIVIMDNGKQIAEGTKESLKALSQFGEVIKVETHDLSDEQFLELQALPFVFKAEWNRPFLSVYTQNEKQGLLQLMQFLSDRSIDYVSFRNEVPTLNDVFLEITGKQLRD